MKMALIGRKKICFVDGTIVQPPENNAQFRLWLQTNNIEVSWLLNSISKEITSSVIYASNTREI